MSDEIEVPVIEITTGWTVDDIATEDDCDDAFAVLTAMCARIEARMDDLIISGMEVSHEYKKAKIALRWKKAALQVIQHKRAKMLRASRLEQHEKTRSAGPSGMSLRDWFAGQAMAGILADPGRRAPAIAERISAAAYEVADAMLAAREGGAA